ncbi:MAG: hypothetical protein KJ600_04495 [Nanoarchaeota archaeon]|nr:hypothetical protein [Nanoarchaeota archaeon]MBU1103787.1 hypothetical protein [Nanoarchaeota archaeon]
MGEFLSWLGSMLNFSILVYFASQLINQEGAITDFAIASFGVFVGALINLYNLLEKR